ncbi:MAG: M20 family metallopeptidase, partial [Candidatus Zipacnadales bacterium]
METRILAHVENMESHLVQTVRELVAINTINPYSGDPQAVGEWAGQQHLRPRLEALGAQITLFEPPPDIYERMGVLGPLNRDFTDRPNLVAEISYGASGPTIILNGHMDTVGAQEMVCNPFAGEVHDGAIWGRGPTDCKGGLAVGLCALEALRDLGLEMKGRVIFESVVDEECNGSGAGTMACVEAGYRGDMAIFLDGNDGTMTLGCYGCLTADIHVTGQEGHAAYGTGVSALEKALIAKEAVDAFAKARLAKQQNCRTNIGIFEAGVHPAVVPGRAYMSLNMVYTYHEALAAEAEGYPFGGGPIREVFEQAIAQADRKDPWLREHPSRVEWI